MAAEPDPESSDFKSTSSSSSETVSTSSEDYKDQPICSICCLPRRRTIKVADCDELKSIRDFIQNETLVTNIEYACQTCLYKVYAVIDQNRLRDLKEDREHRLGIVGALIESTGGTKPSLLGEVKKYDDDDDEELDESNILADENKEIEQESQDEETESINHTEVEDVGLEIQPNLNGNPEVVSNPSSSHAELDIMYEHSEAALMTESGGTLDQYKNPPLQCRYCPKVFVIQKRFNRHMRSHQSKLRSNRSGSSSRGRSTPTNIIYACTDCSATFDSSAKLKNHCRIHMKRYYCMYCHKENLSLFDHEFHEAECKGIHMAKEEVVETRRITRSIARSTRSAQSVKTTKTIQSGRNSLAKTRNDVDDDYDDDDDDDDADDGDCATSVAYTDYTGVNSFVEKWVAGTCRSEYGRGKSPQCMDMEEVVVSQKEHELLMLERLLIQSSHNVYTCFIRNCDHVTNNLRDMCLHEITIHKVDALYFCRKCRGVFTSKLFMDYHFYMQTYADYRCNKCPMRFNYEYQLQYHLLQHQKNNAYPCLYCGNSYMSDKELRIHCIDTTHDPKKRKKTISIDSTMTIVNETMPEPPPPKRTYKCTINIMKLPKMPTKRPKDIDWPKRESSIFFGDIDFEYQPRKNCVRTK